jgi:hypothetical protein
MVRDWINFPQASCGPKRLRKPQSVVPARAQQRLGPGFWQVRDTSNRGRCRSDD